MVIMKFPVLNYDFRTQQSQPVSVDSSGGGFEKWSSEHLSQSVNFFGTHVNFRIAFLCGFRPLSRAEIAVERIDGELFTLQKYYIGIF